MIVEQLTIASRVRHDSSSNSATRAADADASSWDHVERTVARGGRDRGVTMNERLLELLDYRVVLGVLVTSLDGLVVAHAGLSPDDAEMLAAASATQSS